MVVSVYGIDRGLWDHPDLAEEPYTQKQAWAWLIGAAAYQDKRIRTTRGPVTLRRGEVAHAIRFLAKKWLWEKGKTERFLNMLKKRDMISVVVRDNVTIYFINNYNKFQIVKAPKRDNDRDELREAIGTTAGQQRDKEKDTEDSKDIKTLSRALHDEFERQFWPICCRKVGKAPALKAFLKARKTVSLETLIAAMRSYTFSRAGEDERYTAHPKTWLSQERWNDEATKLNGATGPPTDSLEMIIAKARALDEEPPPHAKH